ncbi:hypothetical protein L596_025137 [Steinernema carpocapsae]|uniref:Uncharacterized protein n=1 Tax=Steinernema carpocapsae TaxID=34508 RepID=A0A4U5M6X7_STECR|nr:hypothetical protein L596_025137 [Steinernema carpocapsae]
MHVINPCGGPYVPQREPGCGLSESGSSVPRDDVLLKGAWKPMLEMSKSQWNLARKGGDAETRKALEGQKRTKRVKISEKADLAQAEA